VTITNGYLTTDEARQYAGLSYDADTELLDDVVTAVSRAIDQACQRHFWQTSAGTARYFESPMSATLHLGAFCDLVTVTEVKVDRDGDGTYEETITASDYALGPANPSAAPEQRPYTQLTLLNSVLFPVPGGSAGTGRVALTRITGTWGWPAVPAAVKQACRIQVARIVKRQESPMGVAGFGEFGVVRLTKLDPDVDSMLQPYKLAAYGIA
jgi:hypothetical protein